MSEQLETFLALFGLAIAIPAIGFGLMAIANVVMKRMNQPQTTARPSFENATETPVETPQEKVAV
jgi:hypothetical protein